MSSPTNIREIPYNYTSFSDREVVIRFLGAEIWQVLNRLRSQRRTGSSARMLFDILGDMWIIRRNPYIQDDLVKNPKRRAALNATLQQKLDAILARAADNAEALQLIDATNQALAEFNVWLTQQHDLRKTLSKKLGKFTDVKNIHFDGLSRVAHVTDASDWRVEYPDVVLTPENEDEVVALTKACLALDMNIIARGGGTGYTGGAVPLTANAVIINTEKLDFIDKIKLEKLPGHDFNTATIRAGAGAVTRKLSDQAQKNNLVFAVDPTSQDSSTIGGNIAMNAGGKKALMWGTTLDNLASWRMVLPDGKLYEMSRINHNLGKIHDVDKSHFSIQQVNSNQAPVTITLRAEEARKPGLGKDVTNKILGKLPGVQKEGCDGIITSAVFVLHPQFAVTHTVCLEFFNRDMRKCVPAISKIVDFAKANDNINLTGLEHLDARYIKAVGYSSKSSRTQLPYMLLLADIAGQEEGVIRDACQHVIALCQEYEAEGFIATTKQARTEFWADRARTAAIAAHTNAFKINEDVVIPLERLGDYASGIEKLNIRQAVSNKLATIRALHARISKLAISFDQQDEMQQLDWQKSQSALEYLHQYQSVSEFSLRTVIAKIDEIFNGEKWKELRAELAKIDRQIYKRRIFIATHMHAGDGNVHTNIPVHSNDYLMLTEAEKVVDEIMQLTISCGGVISGEHGIGLTKIKYLQPENIDDFQKYKQGIDKNDNFNRGKLQYNADLSNAYTPSLRLLEMEALLLEESELGKLNTMVKDCLRCGKCKVVCSTHVPRARLLYSPRNKVLATGLLIEAFLYEEQTRRGISSAHFRELDDVANHCTVCHRCFNPCPVNIDFGEVTVQIRNILQRQGEKPLNLGSKLSLFFLNITSAKAINIARKLFIVWGYKAQRQVSLLFKGKPPIPNTNEHSGLQQQLVNFLKTPMPKDLPARAMRAMLELENNKTIPLIRKTSVADNSEAVFYFPGCGAERLFSQIGLSVLQWLYHLNVTTILPPSYICCGYPQLASGDEKTGNKIVTDNRVLLHRMARALNYLDVKKIIVSCGTCLDQLLTYELERLFPQAELMDIHEYLMEKEVVAQDNKHKYLLHDPCHSPSRKYDAVKVATNILGTEVNLSDRCCGESGTFAIARPDISSQVKFRKSEELAKDKKQIGHEDKILTTCPSCLQGLMRAQPETGITADFMLLEMSRLEFGDNWQSDFVKEVKRDGIEHVLL